MTTMKIRRGGRSFQMLVPVLPYGTDPTIPGLLGSPFPIRETVTCGPMSLDRKNLIARMNIGVNPITVQAAVFTVANNDFSSRAKILFGNHSLLSNVDFLPGAGVNATAANIAAAINRLRAVRFNPPVGEFG